MLHRPSLPSCPEIPCRQVSPTPPPAPQLEAPALFKWKKRKRKQAFSSGLCAFSSGPGAADPVFASHANAMEREARPDNGALVLSQKTPETFPPASRLIRGQHWSPLGDEREKERRHGPFSASQSGGVGDPIRSRTPASQPGLEKIFLVSYGRIHGVLNLRNHFASIDSPPVVQTTKNCSNALSWTFLKLICSGLRGRFIPPTCQHCCWANTRWWASPVPSARCASRSL